MVRTECHRVHGWTRVNVLGTVQKPRRLGGMQRSDVRPGDTAAHIVLYGLPRCVWTVSESLVCPVGERLPSAWSRSLSANSCLLSVPVIRSVRFLNSRLVCRSAFAKVVGLTTRPDSKFCQFIKQIENSAKIAFVDPVFCGVFRMHFSHS